MTARFNTRRHLAKTDRLGFALARGQRGGKRGQCDIGDHLDRQRRAKDRARVFTCKVPGQKAKRHGGKAGADQRHDLRGKEMAEGRVLQCGEHFRGALSGP